MYIFAAKMNLQINQTFLFLSDFKEAMRNWAIVHHFEYRWAFSDSQRAKAVCVHAPGCLFAVRCNWYKALSIARVTVLVSKLRKSCIQPEALLGGGHEEPRAPFRLKDALPASLELLTLYGVDGRAVS
jgi:hypothetical protein